MRGTDSVLHRDYIPNELPHRDGHIQSLRNSLARIPNPEEHELIALYGPAGSGKTTVARYVAQRFDDEYPELTVGYVDCVTCGNETTVLHELLKQTGHLPKSSGPKERYDYLARIRDATDPILLIIDELDFLEDPSVIHALYGTYGVWVILIGIDEYDVLQGINSGTRSRLQSAHHIRLSKYTNQQLADILWDRINLGLRHDLVSQSVVREIANRARGDAHYAISLLRECVNQLDPNRPEEITVEHVDEVQEKVSLDIRQRYEEQLATHPRILYTIIKEEEEISSGDLKREYETRVSEARSNRMRQKYLERLEQYNLIEKTGSGRGTVYHYEIE